MMYGRGGKFVLFWCNFFSFSMKLVLKSGWLMNLRVRIVSLFWLWYVILFLFVEYLIIGLSWNIQLRLVVFVLVLVCCCGWQLKLFSGCMSLSLFWRKRWSVLSGFRCFVSNLIYLILFCMWKCLMKCLLMCLDLSRQRWSGWRWLGIVVKSWVWFMSKIMV